MQIIGISERFEAPDAGSWELEAVHMTRPLTRWMATVFPDAATAGFRAGTARYGLLLDCMEFRTVNNFVYFCARGVGAPKGAKGPPPKPIFKLLTMFHPEIRRRVRRSAEVFEKKIWREDVEKWDRETRPALLRKFQTLQKVDLPSLSTAELIAHLDACAEAVRTAVSLHHQLNPVAMICVGDLLLQTREWTGLPSSKILPLLRGSSGVSLGATDELQRVVRAFEGREDLKALLANSDAAAVLDALTSQGDEAGEAVRAYVDAAGIRVVTGYDVGDLSAGEIPKLLVDAIRAAVSGEASVGVDTLAEDVATVRMAVPQEQRARFDELLEEARATYRMRDERGYLNDAWAIGIARRALLEAGRRFVAAGRLQEPEHAVDLTPSEVTAALRGEPSPSAAEIAAFHEYRTTRTVADAPPILGLPKSGPPPAEWLPPAAARMERAIQTVLGEMFAKREVTESTRSVEGFAASPGEVTGIARVVLGPDDIGAIRAGEILVTRATGPSYNSLLPLIRGIVTDRGGTLSHAALVAREYGIPAVVGCGNATAAIQNGARIRVDGTRGVVEVLS